MYQSKFGPSYRVSYSVSIGLLALTVVSVCVAWFMVRRQDERARLGVSGGEEESAVSWDEKAEERQREA